MADSKQEQPTVGVSDNPSEAPKELQETMRKNSEELDKAGIGKNARKPAKSVTVGNWPKTLPGHPPAAPGR